MATIQSSRHGGRRQRHVAHSVSQNAFVKGAARKRARALKVTRSRPWVAQIDRLQEGFGLTQIQLAEWILHVSPRSLILWRKNLTPNRAALIRLNELDRLYSALAALMPAEDVAPWMNQTNGYVDPFTPLEILNRGEIDRLWQIVHNVGTGMPT